MSLRIRGVQLLVFVLSFSFLSCSKNLLSELSNKKRDEALLFDAKMLMNDSQWDDAIAKFSDMSTDFVSHRDVKMLKAKAYAGKCGLDLLQLFETLGSELATTNLFLVLMRAFEGATTAQADACITSESIMLSISSTAANRTQEENINLAYISLAKVGAILAAYADEATPDGSPDAGFDACSDSTDPGIPNSPTAYAGHIATGFSIAVSSLSAVISSGGSVGSDELDSLSEACSTGVATDLPASYNFCGETDPSALTADKIKGIRSLVQDDEFVGVGSCTGGLASCICL